MFAKKPSGTWTDIKNTTIRKENKMKKNINHILYLKSIKELNTLNKCINDMILPIYNDCLCTKGSENGDYLIEVDDKFLYAVGHMCSELAHHEIEYCFSPSTSNFMIKDKNGKKVTYLDPADVMDYFFNHYKNKSVPPKQLNADPILISLTKEQDRVLSTIERMYQKFTYKEINFWQKEWRSDNNALVGRYGCTSGEEKIYSIYAFDRERIGYLFHVLKRALDMYYMCDLIYWYDPEHTPRLVQIQNDDHQIASTSIQDFFNSTLEIVKKGLITHPVDEEKED